ncbi:MAG TPA: S8 family serine peptidase [Blastocatellia bacterium]|nr:S8 family serine peptidase [Blastocatellia bacterium]
MRFEAKIPFAGLTGRGVRVAIIDSGVNPAHPHVAGVAGGVHINADGEAENYLDYIGHGTAVAGAIREKAPGASLYAIKVFDQLLRTNAETIIRAIDWAIENEIDVVNLSLGTVNEARRERFEQVVARAAERNVVLVAAREMNGQRSLPGCLPSVIGVTLDWECPRETYRYMMSDSRPLFCASGYPRSIPGVAPERNLSGISFAVASITGFVTRAKEAFLNASSEELERVLIEACA